MSHGFDLPRFPTFWEMQEQEAERYWKRLVHEVRDFQGRVPEGSALYIVTTVDPEFNIVTMKRSGDYVILDGVDGDRNEGRMLQHRSQLSIRMRIVPATDKPEGIFGFIQPNDQK